MQLSVYKEDFENERRDKQRALSEKDSLIKQTTTLLNDLKILQDRVYPPRRLSFPVSTEVFLHQQTNDKTTTTGGSGNNTAVSASDAFNIICGGISATV